MISRKYTILSLTGSHIDVLIAVLRIREAQLLLGFRSLSALACKSKQCGRGSSSYSMIEPSVLEHSCSCQWRYIAYTDSDLATFREH